MISRYIYVLLATFGYENKFVSESVNTRMRMQKRKKKKKKKKMLPTYPCLKPPS